MNPPRTRKRVRKHSTAATDSPESIISNKRSPVTNAVAFLTKLLPSSCISTTILGTVL